MKLRLTSLFIFLSALLTIAHAQQPLPVVATFSILGDVVANVGGDAIALTVLVGAGSDTHTYEPVPQDSVLLNEANLVFENGLGLEAWLDDLYTASGSQAQRVVVSAGMTPGTITVGDEAGDTDPHIWQNPYYYMKVTEIVRDTLVAADPANTVTYQLNANRYLTQLLAADTYALEQVQTLPADQRQLVTNHDAFGYLANRYGLTLVGTALGSISTDGAEPSAGETAALIEQIRTTGARAIFPENVENDALVRQIAQETGVTIGAPLCSDALSPADGPCPTYLQMIRYNVDSLVGAMNP